MDESCWTPFNLSFPHANEGLMAYTHTKTFSEKELLEHNENSVLELDVVSIACGLLGGDTLLPSMPESMGVLISQVTNNKGTYHVLRFLEELLGKVPIVHIEVVSEAHILCMEKPLDHWQISMCYYIYVIRRNCFSLEKTLSGN